ncbi:MAG: DUF4335 domain-containing protein [Elainellaceae cyanobacterium]
MDAIRRYSPPTCTIELLARTSPLSRWTQRPVLTDVRFRLSFDGPHRPADERLTVTGSQAQLDAIADIVQQYVQHLLTRSVRQFAYQLQPSGSTPKPVEPDPLAHRSAPSPAPSLSPEQMSPEWATSGSPPTVASLKPLTQLQHQLQINLSPRPTSIDLSTMELLDVADALDAYGRDGIVATSAPSRQPPIWMRTAAAALLAVGVTGTMVQIVRHTAGPQTAQNVAVQPEIAESEAAFDDSDQATTQQTDDSAANAPERASEDAIAAFPELGVDQAGDGPQGAAPAPATTPQNSGSPTPASTPPTPAPPSGTTTARANETIPPELSAIPPIEARAEAEAQPSPAERGLTRSIPRDERAFSTPEPLTPGPAPISPSETVRQVQSAVQSRWQPPDGLGQSLEYRVSVAADGTLQRVLPIGDTARAYLPDVAALRVGETVSPPLSSSSPPIRVVLRQDGRVQAFLERL